MKRLTIKSPIVKMLQQCLTHLFSALLLFVGSYNLAQAKDYVINQKNKRFSEKSISIKQGDSVTFLNSDPMTHNIYSISESDAFDLGSYRKDQQRKHHFENTGEYEIECAIHPFMLMTIIVE